MTVTESVRGLRTSPTALVFTNMRGQIIFVDKQFLKMLQYQEMGLVGAPFHKVVGIEADLARNLLQDVAQSGYIDGRDLRLQTTDGRVLNVSCSGIATYDENGKFLGADMTLRDVTSDGSLDFEKATFGDVVSQQVLKIDEQVEELRVKDALMPLQQYFADQIKVLEEVLSQIGGSRLVGHLEGALNETAERQAWSFHIEKGNVTVNLRETQPEAYRALLSKAVNYAVSVIGPSMIARKMRVPDDAADARVLELAEQHGLRELFKRLTG
jgi:PAS domain S-box-containing protein